MRIEQSDVDCLIEVSVFLKSMADLKTNMNKVRPFKEWHARVQKVYILLLQASEKGQAGIEGLVKKGILDDSAAAKAIRALCPFTTPKKNCALCIEGQN